MSRLRQSVLLFGSMVVVLAVIAAISIFGNTRPGARAEILSPRRVEPGELVEFRVSVRDTDGVLQKIELDYGDGTEIVHRPDQVAPCDGPSSEDAVLPHTYDGRGVVTARAKVTTGGCGARTEVVEAVRTVSVRPLRT